MFYNINQSKFNEYSCLFEILILDFRHPLQPKLVHYKYRFQCPDSSYYDPASFDLQMESLESVPWNIIDNVVCSHGMGDHKLSDVCISNVE